MFWLGKILGGVFGYMAGGPFGAVFGIMVGHYFDVSCKGLWFLVTPSEREPQRENIFFQATFTIMGYLAKADGRVSENEIRLATRIMQNMRLTAHYKLQAKRYFRLGKMGQFNIDQLLASLSRTYFQQRRVLSQFINIQVQTAYADGFPSREKLRILEYLCYRLNLNPRDFFQTTHGYEHSHNRNYYNGYQQQRNQHQQYYQQYQAPRRQPDLLEAAYLTLNVNKATNNSDLKKAYRKLMSKYHPDKLVSKGLSEDSMRMATKRAQEIKSAYEAICKSRGI
jgi:DnaJ like chaperone protein